jgi:hypothetical protein
VIALRHEQPVLRHGSFHSLVADGQMVAYGRTGDDAGAVVVLNAGEGAAHLTIPTDGFAGAPLEPIRLPGEPFPLVGDASDGHLDIEVAPRSGAVLLSGGSGS